MVRNLTQAIDPTAQLHKVPNGVRDRLPKKRDYNPAKRLVVNLQIEVALVCNLSDCIIIDVILTRYENSVICIVHGGQDRDENDAKDNDTNKGQQSILHKVRVLNLHRFLIVNINTFALFISFTSALVLIVCRRNATAV